MNNAINRCNSIDIIKLLCCILIIGSHTLPIFSLDVLNYYYGQWFFRFCVPFFFISTGYFFCEMPHQKKIKYIIRICSIYIISTVLYIPLAMKESLLRAIFLGFHHLWYLVALIVGLILFAISEKIHKTVVVISVLFLYTIGVLLHIYHNVLCVDWISSLAGYVSRFGGCRNGVFFAYPLLFIGKMIRKQPINKHNIIYIFLLIISFFLSFIEATYLKNVLGMNINCDLTFFGWLPAVPLLLLSINITVSFKNEKMRVLRKITDVAYIIHWWVIYLLHSYFEISIGIGFILIVLFTFILSFLLFFVLRFLQKYKNVLKNRIMKEI